MMQSRRSIRMPAKPFIRQFKFDGCEEDPDDEEFDESESDTKYPYRSLELLIK